MKVNALTKLGEYLLNPDDELKKIIIQAKNKNAWFTEEQVYNALSANASILNETDLQNWIKDYNFSNSNKKIGLVLAGNIPLVGFHDIISVLLSGHTALIKLSSNDDLLIPTILAKLIEIEPELKKQIQFVQKLENFDAIIATGSNNTSRYFEYYFSKVPHIIRKNRNSIAILSGEETATDFKALAKDILDYFGLGCRNVSKIYVPKGYNFIPFFDAIEEFHPITNHNKYNNNYDYNKSILLVNQTPHLDNGFLLLTKNESLISPLAVLYYEEYENINNVKEIIKDKKEDIQVVVTHINDNFDSATVGFGKSQQPKLWDYADGVDTLKFLSSLN